ncbi:AAA family ATPase [Bacillus albus]|uniref:AAA family ATPase n=1 Tax=Bacillus albus TaxID=2026189 RepID=UPI001020B68D|nr:AAA family ATPase [Bacillus albus]
MISLQSFGKKLPNIALIAKMRSGKDTVYEILQELGFSVYRLAFGDAMKEMAHIEHPEIPRYPKPVEFYQEYGKRKRSENPDVFVRPTTSMLWFQQKLDEDKGGHRTYVFTDVRQPNEYEAVKKAGCKIIKVCASKEVRIARMIANGETVSEEILNAPTEQYLNDFEYDHLLVNNWGRDELRRQIVELVYKLISEEEN